MATIKRICSSCGGYLGEIPTPDPDQDGKVSHGTCNSCLKEQYAEFNESRRKDGKPEVEVPTYENNDVIPENRGPEGRG